MTKCSDFLRTLQQHGWMIVRQGKGSHLILEHPRQPGKRIVLPDHGSREMAIGLENKYRKLAGLPKKHNHNWS